MPTPADLLAAARRYRGVPYAYGDERLPSRFWGKVSVSESGCWTWNRPLTYGYGRFWLDGRNAQAHRVAYLALVAEIPEGLHLDHLCRNRACVNPAHLEPVTCRENLLRGDTLQAANAAKTHCPQGHAYDPSNTYTSPKGRRSCRTCQRNWANTAVECSTCGARSTRQHIKRHQTTMHGGW